MPQNYYNVKSIVKIGAIDFMNILTKDLNLLHVFQMLMQERNVSKAAQLLHLSQPALSNALARLRIELNDNLFVRAGRGMAPTPKALELNLQVTELLQRAQELYGNGDFQPKLIASRFTIAATDYLENLLLPRLLPFLEVEAPNLQLIFRPTLGSLPKTELENGTYDLAIAGFLSDPPENYYKQKVYSDTYSSLVRKNHPKVNESLSLKVFLELEHILVSPQGDLFGTIDKALTEKKLRRKVIAGVSSFSVSPSIIAETDYIVSLPTQLAAHYAKIFDLNLLVPPIKVAPIQIYQVWQQRTHSSAAHRWLRENIYRILKA
jgi:DNA-binding transcriptional LysR family regulator